MTFKKGEIQLIEISKDVYGCMVKDNGIGWSNSGFINKGKGLIIDTMYDLNFAQDLKDLCFKISKRDPAYVVNTHANGDHIWGNQIFKTADIIGHTTLLEDACKENPEDFQKLKSLSQISDDDGIKKFAEFMEPFDFNNIKIHLPNITFEKNMTVNLDGTKIELIHVGPAHTRGDVIVWLPEEKVLFSGDIIFNKCTPICWLGMGIEKWINALDYIINDLTPKVIIPGHGPLCSTQETKDLKEYLEYILTETVKLHKTGITNPMDICKKINLENFIQWTEPERLYINVLSIVKNRNKDFSPPNFIEISKAVNEFSNYLKDK